MVFVTAGYSGKRFIFEKAKELGVRTIVLDGPDRWATCACNQGVVIGAVSVRGEYPIGVCDNIFMHNS